MIIARKQNGPIRTTLEAYGGALALFSPAERNRAKRRAGERGGRFWLAVWMPKRFSGYAYFLGYRVSSKWAAKKKSGGVGNTPYVGMTPPGGGPAAPGYKQNNGAKMADAVSGSTVTTPANGESINIKVPYGHPIQSDKAAAFRTLPASEVEAIANEMADELGRIISGAETYSRRGGSIGMRLSAKHAKPRKSRGAA